MSGETRHLFQRTLLSHAEGHLTLTTITTFVIIFFGIRQWPFAVYFPNLVYEHFITQEEKNRG